MGVALWAMHELTGINYLCHGMNHINALSTPTKSITVA